MSDQLSSVIYQLSSIKRIISTVPSQTELLFDLGLNEEVVGITKFCIHPKEWFRTKTRVGGTKQLKLDVIRGLNPDLIIANKEENVKEQIEELAKDFPILVTDVNNLDDAYEMIEQIGRITDKPTEATQITTRIKENFSQLTANSSRLTCCYLIWKDPYMTIGHDTFIHSMLEAAGFQNVFADKTRYPEISIDELAVVDCQLLLLSSEPYPFSQKHIDELQPHLPNTKILLVDGEMFSWYGSRLVQAPVYFNELREMITD